MNSFTRRSINICILVLLAASVSMAQKLKPEEIIAKHLESIGTSEARSAIKSQMAVGDAVVTFQSQKNQSAQGRIVMASSGNKNFLGLQLNASDYPGEKFSYDGSKAKIAGVVNGQRSFFGNFVDSNGAMLRESLLGGVLSQSWALNDIGSKKVKLSGGGLKKIDGKEYWVVGYAPKGGSDYDTSLYFDKDTFRHVRTEYKRTSSAVIGTNPNQSSGFDETKLKVIETYEDFRDEKGLMLPHTYKLVYSEIGQRGTREVEWAYTLNEFAFNQPMDEKTFDVDAR
jgi:hypothetical protein